jgi:hypothetical protein
MPKSSMSVTFVNGTFRKVPKHAQIKGSFLASFIATPRPNALLQLHR